MTATTHRCARCGTDRLSTHNPVCLRCSTRHWCGTWSRADDLFKLQPVRRARRGVAA